MLKFALQVCNFYKKTPLFLFLSILVLFSLLSSMVSSKTYYIERQTYFPSKSGSYITFNSSLLPIQFTTLYRDSLTRWFFNSTWITTTNDVSFTFWNLTGWLNYTVSGVVPSEQKLFVSEPIIVQFDGVNQTEWETWTYGANILTVMPSGATDVGILFGEVEAPDPPPDPERGEGLNIYLSNGGSLGFQSGSNYVKLTVNSGNFNTTDYVLHIYEYNGDFSFQANENVTIEITYDVENVKIWGDNSNTIRRIRSGSVIYIYLNDVVSIIWNLTPRIWFPIEFIFGMVGLCSMFGSSIMGIYMMNKGEYVNGIRFAVVWFAFGIALTVAWLWA